MKHIILMSVIIFLTGCSMPENEAEQQASVTAERVVKVKDTLHTRYFDVKVESVEITPGIEIPSAYISIMAGEGNMFVILRVVFTNTDTETRAAEEGVLFVRQNGKQYSFEKTETIMAPGWGLFFDPINPLMSQTTNIIYKIPNSVKGEILWQPGRAEAEELIFIANTDTVNRNDTKN
jgi:hypothetical protein